MTSADTAEREAPASFVDSFRSMARELFALSERHDEMGDPDADTLRRLARQLSAVTTSLNGAGDGPALDELAALARERDPVWASWWDQTPLWEQIGQREVAELRPANTDDEAGGMVRVVTLQPLVRCPACGGVVEQQWARHHAEWHQAQPTPTPS